ncbi:erythroferrone [Xenopus tropicalis]|uniref:Adipolin n=1 Tax=Xenopus tropicalis TaxID=8364 RepID=Q0V9G8_XENTR|nr:erythroferrone [Xenopus tropicalis]AAI21577.1 hypothetical protein MGC147116 [Xenopus tropicalis]|eukprot:NP_001072387.1 erythroferrone [Xenopus tropicalis]
MDAEYKPIPLRCVLMAISMAVLLILLCAGPACTHKNRSFMFQDKAVTVLPPQVIPRLTPPPEPLQRVPQLERPPWPPRDSWLMLLKNSDRAPNSKKRGQEESLRPCRRGPIGSPAPAKQHSYNPVLERKKLHHFLQLLSELLRRLNGERTEISKYPLALTPSTVHAAFICKLGQHSVLEPGVRKELHQYQQEQEDGSFNRGAGLNLTSGRYTAPFSGLYAFNSRLNIGFPEHSLLDKTGFLQVQVCIQSLCQKHLSLQQISQISAAPHTLTVHGVLYLQEGQYVSVFLENRMSSSIVVEKGSEFSGVLLGQ